MSTPIIIGGNPPIKTRMTQALKKWGVLAGGAAAAAGVAIVSAPEFGAMAVGIVSKNLDPQSVGYTLTVMGVQQAIVAARRKLLALSEPK